MIFSKMKKSSRSLKMFFTMKNPVIFLLAWLTVFCGMTPLLLSASAATVDPLTLVPANAAAVGTVRMRDFKNSRLTRQLFRQFDSLALDGNTPRYLEAAGLKPTDDIESVTMAVASPAENLALVIVEGRFDTGRLVRFSQARGAQLTKNASGNYFRLSRLLQLPSHNADSNGGSRPSESVAVSYLNSNIIVVGTESSVKAALQIRNNQMGNITRSPAIGRRITEIQPGVTAWALVDLSRFVKRDHLSRARTHIEFDGLIPITEMIGVAKSAPVLLFQTTVIQDRADFVIRGFSEDESARIAMEQDMRSMLGAWRKRAEYQEPALLWAMRKFEIYRNFEGVTLSGVLPKILVDAMLKEKGNHPEANVGCRGGRRKTMTCVALY